MAEKKLNHFVLLKKNRGVDTTTQFFKEYDFNLKPGNKVLDVGCGIGGGDFLLAEVKANV